MSGWETWELHSSFCLLYTKGFNLHLMNLLKCLFTSTMQSVFAMMSCSCIRSIIISFDRKHGDENSIVLTCHLDDRTAYLTGYKQVWAI